MSAELTKLTINHSAARELLRSTGVLDDLTQRAERVAETAARNRGDASATAPTYEIHRDLGRERARVSVQTSNAAARAGEARHHWLLSALDAAR